MDKHTLDYYIPERVLSCQCLYIKLGSMEDGDYPGRTHLLEHLLVAFDKDRTEEERRQYIVQAHTTFEYMCFTVYYNRHLVSDEAIYDILNDIRMAHSIRAEMLEPCKEDVIQEIERYRADKEKIFVNIGNPVYVDRLPIGRREAVSALKLSDIEELIEQKYLRAETNLLRIKIGKLRYRLREERNVTVHAADSQRVLNTIFYDIVFFACAFGMKLSMNEFHMTMMDGRLFTAFAGQYMADAKEKLENVQLFKKSLRKVRSRYAKAQEFGLDQQIQIAGECFCAHERILRLKDVKHVLRVRGWRWLYNRYRKYIETMTILKLDER